MFRTACGTYVAGLPSIRSIFCVVCLASYVVAQTAERNGRYNTKETCRSPLSSSMSSGFGNWNYDQKGGNGGGNDLESGGGGGETTSFLGASGIPAMPEGMSWSNFKSSLEAQMPQKVMGMNYQERFKVRNNMLLVLVSRLCLMV